MATGDDGSERPYPLDVAYLNPDLPIAKLFGALAKLERAEEHLDALHDGIEAFVATEPYRVEVEFHSDVEQHVAYTRVIEDPPFRLSAIVGDVLQNLRSCLDHVAWGVASRTHGEAALDRIAREVAFPITWNPAHFAQAAVLRHLPEDARAFLKWLQPHEGGHRPEARALLTLHELAKVDRHRVLHPTFAQLDLSRILLDWGDSRPLNPFFDLTVTEEDTFEDGTEIGRVSGLGPDTDVSVNRHPGCEVLFRTGLEVLSETRLRELLREVLYVLVEARTFFARK